MTKTAIIIEDDREMRQSLLHLLDKAGWTVSAFADARRAIEHLQTADVILSDVRMPGMSGLDLLAAVDPATTPPIVLVSAHGDIPMAVQAMQDGAYSFLEKPFDPRRLLLILTHAAENHQLRAKTQRLRAALADLSGLDRVLLGQSEQMARLREDVTDVAGLTANVLIEGETGTGKELIANALHRIGARKDAPFVALNCASLEAETVEERLYGPQGAFREAHSGTLFLDEIGSCPEAAQAKMLRAVETGDIGADKVDVRVIAAANTSLEVLVTEGRFRRDLLFRLNTFFITLPPLRERGDDIVFLYTHFCTELARTYEIAVPEITTEDAHSLLAHDWPGNVRELRHVAERRILAARRGGGSVAQALHLTEEADDIPETLREAVAVFERTLIAQAIRTHKGRMDAVAEALGIGRRTLNEKIVKLGLDKDTLL